MARFPKSEADIRTLAQHIINGLTGNADFPSPPVSAADLENLLSTFTTASDAQIAAQAAAQQATETKRTAFSALVAAMKSVLRYAENMVRGNTAKLAALGWSGKSDPTPLEAPGQPRLLEILHQGPGWLHLDWKRPADGSAPAFYKLERRKPFSNDW